MAPTSNALKWIEERFEFATDEERPLLADGFDDAIVGLCDEHGGPSRVVYSRSACIEILIKQGMTAYDAEDYFAFNVEGAYVGPKTPLFIDVYAPPARRAQKKKKTHGRKKLLA